MDYAGAQIQWVLVQCKRIEVDEMFVDGSAFHVWGCIELYIWDYTVCTYKSIY